VRGRGASFNPRAVQGRPGRERGHLCEQRITTVVDPASSGWEGLGRGGFVQVVWVDTLLG
jgi:hypothetical protein